MMVESAAWINPQRNKAVSLWDVLWPHWTSKVFIPGPNAILCEYLDNGSTDNLSWKSLIMMQLVGHMKNNRNSSGQNERRHSGPGPSLKPLSWPEGWSQGEGLVMSGSVVSESYRNGWTQISHQRALLPWWEYLHSVHLLLFILKGVICRNVEFIQIGAACNHSNC